MTDFFLSVCASCALFAKNILNCLLYDTVNQGSVRSFNIRNSDQFLHTNIMQILLLRKGGHDHVYLINKKNM